MERTFNLMLRQFLTGVMTSFRILFASTAGLVAGLVAAAITKFWIVTFFNHPLPPWGWATNVVIESSIYAAIGLLFCRFMGFPSQVRMGIVAAAAIAIGLAFTENGAIVLRLLHFMYFFPPLLAAVATALFCLRFRWRGSAPENEGSDGDHQSPPLPELLNGAVDGTDSVAML